jgi:hypothetical protein
MLMRATVLFSLAHTRSVFGGRHRRTRIDFRGLAVAARSKINSTCAVVFVSATCADEFGNERVTETHV